MPVSDSSEQGWSLEYLSANGSMIDERELPSTRTALWREGLEGSVELPTSAWVRVCSDRVWTLQDGYQLLAHSMDRTLQGARLMPVETGEAASVSLITHLECDREGGIKIEGYLFGVSGWEPPLSAKAVKARALTLRLDRSGSVMQKTTLEASFSASEICASAPTELAAYCTLAMSEIGSDAIASH